MREDSLKSVMFLENPRIISDLLCSILSRSIIKNPPPFTGLNMRIPIVIPIKGRGFINQGSTLDLQTANLHTPNLNKAKIQTRRTPNWGDRITPCVVPIPWGSLVNLRSPTSPKGFVESRRSTHPPIITWRSLADPIV